MPIVEIKINGLFRDLKVVVISWDCILTTSKSTHFETNKKLIDNTRKCKYY